MFEDEDEEEEGCQGHDDVNVVTPYWLSKSI